MTQVLFYRIRLMFAELNNLHTFHLDVRFITNILKFNNFIIGEKYDNLFDEFIQKTGILSLQIIP